MWLFQNLSGEEATNMKEKEIRNTLITDWFNNLKSLFGEDLRLYGLEFPVRTIDGVKYADLIFEKETDNISMNNPMFVLELKRNKIDVGVADQVRRYSIFTQLQLYRNKKVGSVIAGQSFSNWELQICQDNNVLPLQYDLKGNMRIL
jgi:hypothetical protein